MSNYRGLQRDAQFLSVLRDLMQGGRHNRHTISRQFDVSLPTADRWIVAMDTLPGTRQRRIGRVLWVEWECPVERRPKE